MFAYNPGVNDRSGEIIAQGANNAAMLQMQAMENLGQNIASFAGAYVEGQERKAKAKGYTDFLDMHGETLGLNPEWIEEFRKKSDREKIAMGDMIVSSSLPHQQRMQYLERQGEIYPRSGGNAGGGAGGGMKYVVGQGWVQR